MKNSILFSTILMLFLGLQNNFAQVLVDGTQYHIAQGGQFMRASTNGNRIDYSYVTDASALWTFEAAGNAGDRFKFRIKNVSTGKYLANMQSTEAGSDIALVANPGPGAVWRFSGINNGSNRLNFKIVSDFNGLSIQDKVQAQSGDDFQFEPKTPTFFVKKEAGWYYYEIPYRNGNLKWRSTFDYYAGRGTDGCSGPSLDQDYSFKFLPSCLNHDMAYAAPWEAAGIQNGQSAADYVQYDQNIAYCNALGYNGGSLCHSNAFAMLSAVQMGGKSAYNRGQDFANQKIGEGLVQLLNDAGNVEIAVTLKNNLPAATVKFQLNYKKNGQWTQTAMYNGLMSYAEGVRTIQGSGIQEVWLDVFRVNGEKLIAHKLTSLTSGKFKLAGTLRNPRIESL